MSDISVIAQTQVIVVQPRTEEELIASRPQAVSVIHAGPPGPPGIPGVAISTEPPEDPEINALWIDLS